jgi:hypothetical protein
MKVSNKPSAAMAPTIALKTSAEGDSPWRNSKPDTIAEPKAKVPPVLRSVLKRKITTHVLQRGHLESKAAAISLRGKAADLIHLCEVLCSYCAEHISGQAPRSLLSERKSEPSQTGRLPINIRIRKIVSHFG